MGLENLVGRECMVQAAASALNKQPPQSALETRSRQLEEIRDQQLDPFREAKNLQNLLQAFGERTEVNVHVIHSIRELGSLVEGNQNVFVGFAKGQDGQKSHIAHLEKRVHSGFTSKQQFTSNEILETQLDEQQQLIVFLAS